MNWRAFKVDLHIYAISGDFCNVLGAKRLGEEMVWGRNVPDSSILPTFKIIDFNLQPTLFPSFPLQLYGPWSVCFIDLM